MRARRRDLTIVKLGGSHALQPHLRAWLAALSACAGRIVVVAGGGPFADGVRETQVRMGFDDRAAHHMALLAMEQFAVAIASLQHGLVCAASLRAIDRALQRRRVPVWLPAEMVLAAPELPQSWELTSDSLAAWLAGRLGARSVLLVKHGVARCARPDIDALASRGVVDPLFAGYLRASGAEAAIAGPGDFRATAAALGADRRRPAASVCPDSAQMG